VPDEQREGVVRCKVLDTKGQYPVDETLFKSPRAAVEQELERHDYDAQQEKEVSEDRADEPVVEARLLPAEYIIYIVGDVWKALHGAPS